MLNYNSKISQRKNLYVALCLAGIVFIILLSFIAMLQDSFRKKEHVELTQKYIIFESKVLRFIDSNIHLLKGFEAFIKLNFEGNEENLTQYLYYLLTNNSNYIKNIGILKGTKILWNYPKGNEDAIGVDLAMIAGQKEMILKVKNERTAAFQGPIDLVQGGTGFAVRLPIEKQDGSYWGQISIILDAEKILQKIVSYAKDENLDIVITNSENKFPLLGKLPPEDSALKFHMDPNFISWLIFVTPKNGWENHFFLFLFLFISSLIFSGCIGRSAYIHLQQNFKLTQISIKDHLTGLYNRHFLDEYHEIVFATARRSAHKAALCMMDLNRFKKINDIYGHHVGDKVLEETARLLNKSTRAGETVFRLGGDEFLLILPQINSEQNFQVLKDRLLKIFEKEFNVPGYTIKMTFAFGHAVFPDDGDSFDTLLLQADKRLYADKRDSSEIHNEVL